MIGSVSDQLGWLDDACLEQGCDPATLDRMIVVAGGRPGGALASRESIVEASGLFAELGCIDMVVWLHDEITPVLHSIRRGAP